MKNNLFACIWCNNNAREVADYYSNIFDDTRILDETPVVVTVSMQGQKMMLLNGGEMYKPNPAISFMAISETGEATLKIYSRLMENGGKALMEIGEYPFSPQYGWVEDRYGISWQLYTGNDGGALVPFVPTLMFTGGNAGRAKEAIHFYTGIFPESEIQGIMEYPAGGGDNEPAGNVQHAQFNVNGFTLMAMDSSFPHGFDFTEGISLVVNCQSQEEIDKYWNALSDDGGRPGRCGWLKDKYGVSWQVVPEKLGEWMQENPDAQKTLLQMDKLIIADLQPGNKPV